MGRDRPVCRIFVMVGRHAHILRSPNRPLACLATLAGSNEFELGAATEVRQNVAEKRIVCRESVIDPNL